MTIGIDDSSRRRNPRILFKAVKIVKKLSFKVDFLTSKQKKKKQRERTASIVLQQHQRFHLPTSLFLLLVELLLASSDSVVTLAFIRAVDDPVAGVHRRPESLTF